MKPLPDGGFDIVSLGEPMIEFNQTRDPAGRLYLQGFGGDTSNFAIAAARQGARVVKVEPLTGDWIRATGGSREGMCANAIAGNLNKQGIAIDATKPACTTAV